MEERKGKEVAVAGRMKIKRSSRYINEKRKNIEAKGGGSGDGDGGAGGGAYKEGTWKDREDSQPGEGARRGGT